MRLPLTSLLRFAELLFAKFTSLPSSPFPPFLLCCYSKHLSPSPCGMQPPALAGTPPGGRRFLPAFSAMSSAALAHSRGSMHMFSINSSLHRVRNEAPGHLKSSSWLVAAPVFAPSRWLPNSPFSPRPLPSWPVQAGRARPAAAPDLSLAPVFSPQPPEIAPLK